MCRAERVRMRLQHPLQSKCSDHQLAAIFYLPFFLISELRGNSGQRHAQLTDHFPASLAARDGSVQTELLRAPFGPSPLSFPPFSCLKRRCDGWSSSSCLGTKRKDQENHRELGPNLTGHAPMSAATCLQASHYTAE